MCILYNVLIQKSTYICHCFLFDRPVLYPLDIALRYPNGMVLGCGGTGLENVGATAYVNELLLQSHEGFLRIFPGWNSTGSFHLRAEGGFEVMAERRLSWVWSYATPFGGEVLECPLKRLKQLPLPLGKIILRIGRRIEDVQGCPRGASSLSKAPFVALIGDGLKKKKVYIGLLITPVHPKTCIAGN